MPTTSPVTTFTWAIANLERETDDGFVFTAHYTVNANDGTWQYAAKPAPQALTARKANQS
jgi:hypothetical protein